jgi:predicted nucleic acid-binding protein
LSLYLDTSLLVSVITGERDGPRTERWLQSHTSEHLLVSDWIVAEFSAALSRKRRTAQISPQQRESALAAFSRICARNATVLEVTREHFRKAARLANEYEPGIRAGDALHVAICSDCGATLCTLDRRLCEAGPAFGVPTIAVSSLFC